jgi:myo-inositol-1(or 4)-monophosphatase
MDIESTILNLMMTAKRKAVRKLIRDFNEIQHLRSSTKPLNEFVKYAFMNAEQSVSEELMQARPNFSLLSKILGNKPGQDSKNRWIINCLTSHENFTHAMPYFAISIALESENLSGKKEIIASVIDAIALGETYYATKGSGAWVERNSNLISGKMRLRVSSNSEIDNSMILTTYPKFIDTKSHKLRILGCPAISLAYIASGKADFFLASNIHLCDVAPGFLLVQEAGGIVAEDYVINNDNIITSNLVVSNYNIFEQSKKLI